MHLLFDIFQGIGIAAAAGIRPFLPGLVAGALGAANFQIHFDHSKLHELGHGPGAVVFHLGGGDAKFHFIQQAPFLIILGVLAILLVGLEASKRGGDVDTGPGSWISGAFGAAVGALVFAGVLCNGGYAWWPGIVGGIICAGIGFYAVRPVLVRLRSRLDAEAAALGVPLVGEGVALVGGGLSALLPPFGIVAVIALLVLAYLGRGRDDQKYAGLRILR